MNEYDSEKMADVLNAAKGLVETKIPEEADVLLLNTCSIREKAQEKVFSQLGRWKTWKADKPGLIIGVGGCVASQEGEAIIKRAPFVDVVFGPQTLHRLPELIDEVRAKKKAVVDISFPEIEKFDRLPEPKAEGPTAFVSIMEGCSKYCTFCVVPYTRGEEISRPFDDVIVEVVKLASQGVKEINLLGQNVNSYLGPMHDGEIADLATLIHFVAAVDGIERIHFTTSHPVEFSDALIQAYADVPQLANYLHLPVQSGSDRILSNESEKDFEDTMKLIADVGFDQSFSFIYSARPGTPASSLPDDVPLDVKKKRLHLLQHRITQQALAISEKMIGTTQRVLIERVSKKSDMELTGRTENMRWVNFAAPKHLIGEFVDVVITDVLRNSLRGRLVNSSDDVSDSVAKVA